jgi:ComF family protein
MLHESLSFLRRLVMPPFCAACRIFLSEESTLCTVCLGKIHPLVSREISITGTKKMVVHAIGKYDEPLVSLILAKSHGNRTIAYQLGKLAWQMSAVCHLSFDYIVPIPLHWTRYAWRGYNQAEEIAKVIAHNAGKPMVHALSRTRRTSYQSTFKGIDRFNNVHDIFKLRTQRILLKNKKILLVDDVMTSGATLKQASKVLFSCRPASITAVVIARIV